MSYWMRLDWVFYLKIYSRFLLNHLKFRFIYRCSSTKIEVSNRLFQIKNTATWSRSSRRTTTAVDCWTWSTWARSTSSWATWTGTTTRPSPCSARTRRFPCTSTTGGRSARPSTTSSPFLPPCINVAWYVTQRSRLSSGEQHISVGFFCVYFFCLFFSWVISLYINNTDQNVRNFFCQDETQAISGHKQLANNPTCPFD